MLLAELNVTQVGVYKDRAGEVVWLDRADVAWRSSRVLYVSLEGFVGDKYWDGYIATLTPPQYLMATQHGGFCRMGFGTIECKIEAFDDASIWVPPVNFAIKMYYTATTESARETLFQGMAHCASIQRTSVTFDLYGEALDADLLLETENYSGDTVIVPRAFGTVGYRQAMRLPDDGLSRPTYHNGYLTGTLGVDWHVEDDGVNIDANAVDNGDSTFSLTASPVGEVTVSGVGEATTLDEIMSWACDSARLNKNYTNTYALSPSPAVNFWADSQRVLVTFLSDLAATRCHLFRIDIDTETLYLVDMDTDVGSRTLTGGDVFPIEVKYEPPVALIKAKWIEWLAVEESIGKYVKGITHETSRSSAYKYGQEKELEMFHDVKSDIDGWLDAILAMIHKPRVTVPLPLIGSLPVPGEAITVTSNAFVRDLTAVIHCWDLAYDYQSDEVRCVGGGNIS